MKSSREALAFSFTLVIGTLTTLGLLLSINLLTNYHTGVTEQRPLLVVDLMAWPTPVKQAKQRLAPRPESTPALETPVAKKTLRPPAPERTLVAEQQAGATKPAAPMEEPNVNAGMAAEEIPVQAKVPALTKATEDILPLPIPFFQLTQAPRFLHRENPVYPETMHTRGISGVVKLEVLIDKNGRVRNAKILESAGSAFDEAAIQAIMKSTFYPAQVDGQAVAVLLRLPVRFKLL